MRRLGSIRDPAALPGWLATTTRRECEKASSAAPRWQAAGYARDADTIPHERADMVVHDLVAAERHAALREALTRIPPCCQQLIALLIDDPPVPYAQISSRLGIPVGSIGPCRARCLDKLRRDPAIAALIHADAVPAAHELKAEANTRPTFSSYSAPAYGYFDRRHHAD